MDYKSSGSREIRIYDDYQKQMDVYTYLLGKNGFATQPHAYFVFYVVQKDGGGFQNSLPFKEELRRVGVNPSWIENTFNQAVHAARQEEAPQASPTCEHCNYVIRASGHLPVSHATETDQDYLLIPEE